MDKLTAKDTIAMLIASPIRIEKRFAGGNDGAGKLKKIRNHI